MAKVDSIARILAMAGSSSSSGGGGTSNYIDLANKPSINGITLEGNKTSEQLGIVVYDDTEIKKEIADTKKYVDDSIAELDVIDGGTF